MARQSAREAYLRKQLADLLRGRVSHPPFDAAVAAFPDERRGAVPKGAPYSAWMLLEHIRAVQSDFLKTIVDPGYRSPAWPAGFWPSDPRPPAQTAWRRSVAAVKADVEAMAALVEDSAVDLSQSRPWMQGWTVGRLAVLAADHLAYHLGEIILLRRLMGIWKVRG
jgi:hypothetical protein